MCIRDRFNIKVHTCLMIWCLLHSKTVSIEVFYQTYFAGENSKCLLKIKPLERIHMHPKAGSRGKYLPTLQMRDNVHIFPMKWLTFVKCSESISSCTLIDKADFYPRLKKSTSLHFSVRWVYSQGMNTSFQQHSIFIQKMEWDWIMQSDPRVLGNFSFRNAFSYSKSCLFMIK